MVSAEANRESVPWPTLLKTYPADDAEGQVLHGVDAERGVHRGVFEAEIGAAGLFGVGSGAVVVDARIIVMHRVELGEILAAGQLRRGEFEVELAVAAEGRLRAGAEIERSAQQAGAMVFRAEAEAGSGTHAAEFGAETMDAIREALQQVAVAELDQSPFHFARLFRFELGGLLFLFGGDFVQPGGGLRLSRCGQNPGRGDEPYDV